MTSHSSTATLTGIPTYLLVPGPESPLPDPPAETLAQDLPFDELTWENFERLCLRVVEAEATVEQCLEYGVRGQDQQGIDLLSRHRTDGIVSVYQCKRVQEFGPSDIAAAVTKFLSQSWCGTAANFVLCTSHALRTTACADEINNQEKRLQEYKTGFEVWNRTRLSIKLKSLPEIVFDFFGPSWLAKFCGSERSGGFSTRLTPSKVEQYRKRLEAFYRHSFEQNDPGIPSLASSMSPRTNLSKRFVLPDLTNRETVLTSSQRRKPDAFDLTIDDENAVPRPFSLLSETETSESREIRFPVDDWISGTDRALIVGAAGSGKTTLLRYMILDLLSEEPTLPAIAERLGRHLPVWIPFAYWTHTLQRQPQASLVDVLRSWFHSWGEDQLFLLVEEAIVDERLLLIVDGLDEWVDEPTGSLAFAQLERFLDMRKLPALAAARPYALNWLKLSGEWRVARVAGLSGRQRAAVCEIWFSLMTSPGEHLDGPKAVQHEIESLISDLDRSSDLDELSRVPLFLLLLITLRLQGAALPGGRFDAYASIIQHMLRDHPQRKRTAAAIIPTDQLSEREIQTVLARLAFEIQTGQTGGTISEDDFLKLLLEVLMSHEGAGLGLPNADARKVAKGFINIEEGSLGLLVPQGLRTFGFLHRSFQERLAAVYCSNLPIDDQTQIVTKYCGDPQWRETLLHLCSLTPRADELSRLLAAFPDSSVSAYAREGFEEFRIEVAFSDFNLPLQQVKEIATLAFEVIEHSNHLERRRRILHLCLNGLQARRTRELVQPKLDQWCVARGLWRANWLSQLERWPADELTRVTALRALNDEDDYVVRGAANTLSTIFRSDSGMIDDLAQRAQQAFSVSQRAACIEALVRAVPSHPALHSISVAARETDVPLLQLLGLHAISMTGTISQEDAVMALDLASDGAGGPLPYLRLLLHQQHRGSLTPSPSRRLCDSSICLCWRCSRRSLKTSRT
ncbi:NACHT domain-containing NTPase [Acidobacterium sp. S8]|uniref:NACHT domain-containing protein n=1 Tax=Acidobacterium sp. S8 TaxID=1641854 RepID=UPI00131AADF7|nr:NACHT domain-containing protein [Acidobacterium sp. S8]